MAKRTVPDLKELFKQASEIALQVPESMQEAAFNRAIDLLTGGLEREVLQPATPKKAKRVTGALVDKQHVETNSLNSLIERMDSTQHQGVRSATKVLDRALMVLQIALTEHGIDGLSPVDIARILTDKFRVNTSDAAVRMALGEATNLVNRIPQGRGFIYRIMGPGEDYLSHLGKKDEAAVASKRPVTKVGRRKNAKKASESTDPSSKQARKAITAGKRSAKEPSKKRKKSSGSLGPKEAVTTLIGAGFFATAKTAPEVQEHLKEKRGYNVGIPQLRLAMLRLVRDGVLARKENQEGQYEYTRP